MTPEGVRLQKYLAQRGVASRRAAEEMIEAGRVMVNGRTVVELGTRVLPSRDSVAVDGTPLPPDRPAARTIMLNKLRGYVCSASSADGTTVFELLEDIGERLVTVGRLDKDSEGLLLLSNDGELVHRLAHPRFEKEKAYQVTVSGPLTQATLVELQRPMDMDGYTTRPAEVQRIRAGAVPGRHVLEITLREGRNRQIRRMCETVGLTVHRLVRIRIGPLTLAGLRPGQWRDLTVQELREILAH